MFSIHRNIIRHAMGPMNCQIRMLSRINRGVRFFFKKNLLFTNSFLSGGFMAFGDLVQQKIEFSCNNLLPLEYDWSRTRRMFTVGLLMGPLHHFYYIYLEKLLPKSDIKNVLKKLAADQLIVSPATILFFFYGMGRLEQKSIKESTEEIRDKFIYVYMGDCIFWPSVQCINFYYLPIEYRVVYIKMAATVFNVFLSYMKHFDKQSSTPV